MRSLFNRYLIGAVVACISVGAYADDYVEYSVGGVAQSVTGIGTAANLPGVGVGNEIGAVFTLDTSTLSGSIVDGIGTYTEHFAQGQNGIYLGGNAGQASYTINYTGATPVVTSVSAGTSTAAPSGDFSGFGFAFNFVESATGKVFNFFEDEYQSGNIVGQVQATTHDFTVSAVGGGTVAAPEIDPVSASSALTLLLGGLAVLRSRKRV